MIQAGQSLCLQCGSVISDIAYFNTGGNANGGVILKHRCGKHGQHEYSAYRYDPRASEPEGKKVELVVCPPADCNGLPDTICVRFADGEEPIELRRCCPHCAEFVPLYPGSRYPTFVFVVVGNRSSGKTTLLSAMAESTTINRVRKEGGYPFELDFVRVGSGINSPAATDRYAPGSTNYVRVKQRDGAGNLTTVAMIVLLDAAGELYETFDNPENRLRRVIQPHDTFDGVDGVMYLEKAITHIAPIHTKEDVKNHQDAFRLFNIMVTEGILRDSVPVAYVASKSDELFEGCAEKNIPKLTDASGTMSFPIITRKTFEVGTTNYRREAVEARSCLEDQIVRALEPPLMTVFDGCCKGFVVMARTAIKLDDGSVFDDTRYRHTYNVMDPFLFVVTKLLEKKGDAR